MYHFRTYQAKTENYLEENFHILRVDYLRKVFLNEGHENEKHYFIDKSLWAPFPEEGRRMPI